MRIRTVLILGLILSLITMYMLANEEESGDQNAIAMYYVVFFIPAAIIVVLNALYIKYITSIKNKRVKVLLSFIPLLILGAAWLLKNLTLPLIDGNLVFVTLTGAIALGITNILWAVIAYTKKN